MRTPKRWIAALLTAVMLFSALPGAALASEADEDGVQQEEQVTPAATPSEEEESDFETLPQDEDNLTGFISKDDDVYILEDDTVTFNTQYMDIVVGHDVEKAEQGDTPYVLFADDDSYTIELYEEAPFFPYEVQFTYQGYTTTEWFMDENDCVTVGGHPFYVNCYGTPNHVGFLVSGEYVPAFPEPKEFVNDPYAAMPISLLPLKEVSLSVDLKSYLPSELGEVGVDAILTNQSIAAGSAVVWAKGYNDDNYTIADMNSKLDLTPTSAGSSTVRLELIVGTADQLDASNVRYTVTVNVCSLRDFLQFSAYTTAGDALKVSYQSYGRRNGEPYYQLSIVEGAWTTGPARLSLSLNSEFSGGNTLTATVYEGRYTSADNLPQSESVITDMWKTTGASAHLADYSNYQNSPEFTVALSRNGTIVQLMDFSVYMYVSSFSVSLSSLYAESTSEYASYRPQAAYRWDYGENDYDTYIFTMESGYPANGSYYFNLSVNNPDSSDKTGGNNGINYVKKAVVGKYTSASTASGAADIKSQLFSDADEKGGYKADYSNGVTFTVFLNNGSIRTLTVKAVEAVEDVKLPDAPTPLSSDTYFRMNGAKKAPDGSSYSSYVMPYGDDSYYYNGYQTVFLLDGSSAVANNSTIYPMFYLGNKVDAHLGHDGESTTKQTPGKSSVEFKSGEAIHYSAAAENGTHLKNYWVTFLTQQSGAHLFVNGATNADPSHCDDNGTPVREVFLDDAHGNHHDVFFANIGDAVLTGLYVKLEDAQNIKLDEYWTVHDGSANTSLAAFNSTESKTATGSYAYYGELMNVAKVRLMPDGAGAISGTLTIGSTGSGEEVKIKLTGTAGTPKITTTSIVDGVKYVPYSSVIQTNNMYASDAVRFERVAGTLPGGMYVKPNGEVYGVPQAAGTFTFTVRATYNNDDSLYDEKEFTLVIAENTDANVYTATDSGYTVTDHIGTDAGNYHFVLDGYKDQVFRTEGEFGDFIDLWLDGRKLTRGIDYTAESGSTVITIFGGTLDGNDDGSGDTHTIAAEFREGDKEDGTLKRAAQNYVIEGVSKPSNPTNPTNPATPSNPSGPSGSNNNSKPDNTSKPADDSSSNSTPNDPVPEAPNTFFNDVAERDWFYDDVKWAFENELMVGVSEHSFAPDEPISQATIVTLLARMLKIDLSQFDGIEYDDILPGQWYTNAAIWAKQSGILPDYSTFKGTDVLPRDGMAIMLVNFLRSMGVDVNINFTGVTFEDADLMTADGLAAFQILYHYGIFRGVGGYRMDPQSSTTRAQFAALMHRISVFIESR